MSLPLTRRIARAAEALDPVSDLVQAATRAAVAAIPRPLQNVLDGKFMGVPLHPALTDVPVGAWTAGVAFDSIDGAADSDAVRNAADGALLIGVLGAVPAALTGMNDWSHLRGEPKRVGTVHALLNATALGLNVASLALRRAGRRDLGRALSGVAFLSSGFSAHLGGELSYGYGVRVNPTAFERAEEGFVPVLSEAELTDELRRVTVGNQPVVVTRARDGRPCAIGATCTHLSGPLDEGERDGDVVVCPWHGSRFDLCTGEVDAGPAVFPQPRFEARVRDGAVEVRKAV